MEDTMLIRVYILLIFLFAQTLARQCPDSCNCKGRVVNCEHKKGNKLQRIPPGIPPDVQTLYLGYNHITTIGHNDLAEFVNLTVLSFKGNYLATIETGAFKYLASLKSLYLTNNRLGALDKDVFLGLTHLKYLYLSQNFLTSIPDLSYTSSLIKLNLDNNHLHNASFPPGISNIKTLTTLVLSINPKITQLYTSDFASFPLNNIVTKIDISRCNIADIENGTFVPFGSLKSLVLSYNPLKAADLKNIIKGLSGIKVDSLDLSGIIQGGYLPNDTFSALKDVPLRTLTLAHCTISVIKNGTFQFFPRLKILNLSYIKLEAVDPEAFQGLTSIETLNLRHNSLSNIPLNLPPSLVKLHLSYNHGIEQIPNDIFIKLNNLLQLLIRECNVRVINDRAFEGVWNLQVLDLSGNILSGNNIGNAALANLRNLQFLFLSSNNMNRIVNQNRIFAGLINLSYLSLEDNNCQELPSGIFEPLVKLERLFLADNKLGYILNSDYDGQTFKGLTNLKVLSIPNNEIRQLPGAVLRDLTSINTIDMEGNVIYHWDQDVFSKKPNLTFINLAGNRLALINRTSVENLNRNVQLNLTGNPFACSCDLRWFRRWVSRTNVILLDLKAYQCFSPRKLEGKPLLSFNADKIWVSCAWLYFLYGGIAIATIFVASLSLILYVNRWRIRVRWYYIRRLSMKRNQRMFANPEGDDGDEQLIGREHSHDAFVSYTARDDDINWIEQELMEQIDDKHGGDYRMFYDRRDLFAGRSLDALAEAMINSRKMILVLSQQYLEDSETFNYDLPIALTKASRESFSSIIIILVEPQVAGHPALPQVLRHRIENRDALEWPQNQQNQAQIDAFWQELKEKLQYDPPPCNV